MNDEPGQLCLGSLALDKYLIMEIAFNDLIHLSSAACHMILKLSHLEFDKNVLVGLLFNREVLISGAPM